MTSRTEQRRARERARRQRLVLAASSVLSLVAGTALGYTLGLRARLLTLAQLPEKKRHEV